VAAAATVLGGEVARSSSCGTSSRDPGNTFSPSCRAPRGYPFQNGRSSSGAAAPPLPCGKSIANINALRRRAPHPSGGASLGGGAPVNVGCLNRHDAVLGSDPNVRIRRLHRFDRRVGVVGRRQESADLLRGAMLARNRHAATRPRSVPAQRLPGMPEGSSSSPASLPESRNLLGAPR